MLWAGVLGGSPFGALIFKMLTKALKCPQTVGQRQVSNVHPTWCQLVPNDAQRVAVKEAQLEPTKFPSGPGLGLSEGCIIVKTVLPVRTRVQTTILGCGHVGRARCDAKGLALGCA